MNHKLLLSWPHLSCLCSMHNLLFYIGSILSVYTCIHWQSATGLHLRIHLLFSYIIIMYYVYSWILLSSHFLIRCTDEIQIDRNEQHLVDRLQFQIFLLSFSFLCMVANLLLLLWFQSNHISIHAKNADTSAIGNYAISCNTLAKADRQLTVRTMQTWLKCEVFGTTL